ncbi:MAG: efflux RND transporter periplasmic adaptor subunit [Xanthobacteraceae bacterium]|nr:efflux RND transporter periplasmic adaptor subunit [Xanthobacteraceae bacterium]
MRNKSGIAASVVAVAAVLAACGQGNQYVAPPLPKVAVAKPTKQPITRYLEATGNTAAVNSADLVARVNGFIETINYQDGAPVKKGDLLFTIELEPYKVKLEQAQATEESANSTYNQQQAAFERSAELIKQKVTTQASYDQALANRDAAKSSLDNARANTRLAQINYDYAQVRAPFDGIVTARKVSVGTYVGGGGTPTVLATIVQLDPIWVNFNISEQDVIRVRAALAERGATRDDVMKYKVEAALQDETNYPHVGTIDYVAPTLSTTTGTLAVRGLFQNPKNVLLPGYFVRLRIPSPTERVALLVPDVALGSDQSGRYVLVVGKDDVVEQRKVEIGPLIGTMRVIDNGLNENDRVVVSGTLRAIPGQKVDPQAAAPEKTAAR